MTADALQRDALIVVCAISAGIHAAFAPAHFAEGAGAGLGFAAAAVALAGLGAALSVAPRSRAARFGALAVLAGLLASYALAVTSGLPVLHPEPEPIDGLAVATKAIETAGLLAALNLLPRTKGTLA